MQLSLGVEFALTQKAPSTHAAGCVPPAVSGALRCLCLMAQDLDEERKPALLADVSAALHGIVSAEAGALAAAGGGGGGDGGGGGGGATVVRMALRIMAELVAGEA